MRKSIFFRLIVYALIVILFRIVYIIAGYLLGFGSTSDQFRSELILDIIFFLLNILSYWIFLHFINYKKKYLELIIVSSLTLLFYILQFIFFYQNYFFNT